MVTMSLRAPANLVSPRARWLWTVRALLGWLVVLGIEAAIWLGDGSPGLAVLFFGTAAVAVAHVSVMPQWRYRVHRWEVTGEAVYTQSGWLKQEWRIAPISRIQTVDVERGPLEQLFGLARLTVTTASAAGPLRISGLDREVAVALADELTRTTQAARGDAT